MAAGQLDEQDALLLERLGAIAAVVDPVPDHVVELGKAAFAFRTRDAELMQLVSAPVDPTLVRSGTGPGSASSHLHFFEHGTVTLDIEVTVRGGFASLVGVVADSAEGVAPARRVVIETADSSTTVDVVDGRFTAARLPLGLVRLTVEHDSAATMTTGWFEVG